MPVRVFSACMDGLQGTTIQVEVDVSSGLPTFNIVGLGDSSVQESKERVRSAIRNIGAKFPLHRKTINLAPADVRKHGPAYDLPIAVALLAAEKEIPCDAFEKNMFIGELSLTGEIRKVRGILPIVAHAKKEKFEGIFMPAENIDEALLINGINIYPYHSLKTLLDDLQKNKQKPEKKSSKKSTTHNKKSTGFSHIKGQEEAKRALEIAAAGHHHILMSGPPGIGKTLLGRALTDMLPEMTEEEMLEVTAMYSIKGLLTDDEPIITQRPFREVHQTISQIGLLGGGNEMNPGEMSLAHHGVLFFDEMNEFPTRILESLRQPLETRQLSIQRAHGNVTFPANILLVGTMNPCPCGHFGTDQCICPEFMIERHRRRISGPLLDRIDIRVSLQRVETQTLFSHETDDEKRNQACAEKIQKAREMQRLRYQNEPFTVNAHISPERIRDIIPIDQKVQKMIESHAEKTNISARSCHRILKISRTIADLEGCENIKEIHCLEAMNFKTEDAQ